MLSVQIQKKTEKLLIAHQISIVQMQHVMISYALQIYNAEQMDLLAQDIALLQMEKMQTYTNLTHYILVIIREQQQHIVQIQGAIFRQQVDIDAVIARRRGLIGGSPVERQDDTLAVYPKQIAHILPNELRKIAKKHGIVA